LIHEIPFFITTNFEFNIFVAINMQFFYFAIYLHHRCVTCSFKVLSKELGYRVRPRSTISQNMKMNINLTTSKSIIQSITLGCPLGSSSELHPITPASLGLPRLALVAHVALIMPFQTALSWALSQNIWPSLVACPPPNVDVEATSSLYPF
jgi:hypothetical protein